MKTQRLALFFLISFQVVLAEAPPATNGGASRKGQTEFGISQTTTREREAAALFAPIFYQALGDKPRSDYLTNFDFDGDWRGDNNWQHLDDSKFLLKAYVYYAVVETATHLFIHYAVFHPRDYKGGERKGAILSELIREGMKRSGDYDPTGLAAEAAVAHENDMEGCLVVVAKKGQDLKQGQVAFVETLHHNLFSKYLALEATPKRFEHVDLERQRVLLYIEPKGHGIEAYEGDEKQTANKKFLIYKFTGNAEDPEKVKNGVVGYDLVPIQTTLWAKAQNSVIEGQDTKLGFTYGETHDYGEITVSIVQADERVIKRKLAVGKIGSAFLGGVGGVNMARPPWGWFDRNLPHEQLGLWFFDPATIIKRDFQLDDSFSTAYVGLPFWAGELKETRK
jgi:hypothetical protein